MYHVIVINKLSHQFTNNFNEQIVKINYLIED